MNNMILSQKDVGAPHWGAHIGRQTVFFLTVLFFASLLAACNVATPNGDDETLAHPQTIQPNIVFPEGAEHDFGIVKQSGGVVRHDFPFTYRGNVPLTITGTPTSCACTGASVNRATLNPGESGVLTVTLNPNLHAEPHGRFFKTALILTDPPLPETPEVTIFAEIDLDLGPEAYELKEHDDDDKEHGEGTREQDHPEAAGEFSGAVQAGHIEAKTVVVSDANVVTLRGASGGAWPEGIPAPEKTAVFLSLDNHQEDLSVYDYGNLASLDGDAAEGWTPLTSVMGGHHITGVLTFPKTRETPKELRITGVSVGKIVIPLTKSQ